MLSAFSLKFSFNFSFNTFNADYKSNYHIHYIVHNRDWTEEDKYQIIPVPSLRADSYRSLVTMSAVVTCLLKRYYSFPFPPFSCFSARRQHRPSFVRRLIEMSNVWSCLLSAFLFIFSPFIFHAWFWCSIKELKRCSEVIKIERKIVKGNINKVYIHF